MNTAAGSYEQISLGSITRSTTNPRKSFDDASMAELTASVREAGVQSPILLRPVAKGRYFVKSSDFNDGDSIVAYVCHPKLTEDGQYNIVETFNTGTREQNLEWAEEEASQRNGSGGYEIVCGERRFRAATAAGLETIPAIVRELDDAEAYQAQIIENLQREGVHPAEEADSYAAMMGPDGLDMSVEDVAKKVGKTTGYVAQRLRLRTLEIDAKLLFIKGTITLGHALLLARLTPKDQERAIRFMLDCDPKYDKRSVTELVRDRLGMRRSDGEVPVDEGDEGEDEDEGISYNMPNPQVAKYMRHGRRVVDATEAQLKRWIESNVLLKLASVPWRLDDAELLPAAGACVSCPKRSGSNAALFGDLTAEADVCLDTVCFSAKQDATLKAHKAAAKGDGTQLLKISSKPSEAELEEIAVSNGVCVTKKTVKRGQWIAVPEKPCGNTLEALMVDGPDKGKLVWCCADQKCKVHKHSMQKPGSYGYVAPPVDPVKAAAEKAKVEAFIVAESALRREAYDLIAKHVKEPEPKEDPDGAILRYFVLQQLGGYNTVDCEKVCVELGIAVPPKAEPKKGDGQYGADYKRNEQIEATLRKTIETATPELLWLIAFHVTSLDAIDVSEYQAKQQDRGRRDVLQVAARFGLAKSVQAVFDRAAKKAVAKPAKKKVIVKAAKPAGRKLSPAAKKQIAANMKKRWSAARKKAAKA